MNSKFKRLLACLLSLMMVVSLFPMSAITAFAAEADEIATVSGSTIASSGTWGGIDWTLTEDGTLTIAPTENEIKDYKHGNKTQLYERGQIPCGANLAWTAYYQPWTESGVAVKKLVIEEGVTSIGTFAFMGMKDLTGEVVIPSTVTYIGQDCFNGTPFTKLTFAAGGTEELCIAQGAFKKAEIEEVSLPDDRPVHLHAWVFQDCKQLKSVYLPATLTSVHGTNHRDYAGNPDAHSNPSWTTSSDIFANCSSFKTITFGSEEVKNMFLNATGNAATISRFGVITEVKKPSVAEINGTGYETLAAALAAANAGDTITFVADITDDVTISKAITIDGAGKTFSGTMTVNGVGVTLTVKNATLKAAGSYVIYTKQSNVTIENCTLTSDATAANYYGSKALVKAEQAANSSVKISGCTVSNLYYPVYFTQGGTSLIIENSTITDCVYLASAMKCVNVTIKDVTYTGMAGIMVRNSVASTLSLENVTITTTLNGQSPVAMMQPESGSGVLYTITLKGENIANGAKMTKANESAWFARQNASNPYEIVDLNKKPVMIGEVGYDSLSDAIADAKAGDKIVFCEDINENVTINKAVTIDGAGFKYIGKATVAGAQASVDTVNFINVKFVADTTVGNNVVVDLQRYAEATFDGCDFTSNSTDTYYNSYKGIAVANDCSVEIKNCTASKLYYMIHISQGSKSLVVENCTLTDMVYGIGAFKCENVVVKDFTYSGMASAINVKNSIASTLALENVNITTTMNGQSPVAMWKPDAGNITVNYTITLKGENVVNGAAMTKANEADWFARQDASNLYEIKDLNGLAGSGTATDPYQIGSVEDLIKFRDSVNAGETKYNAPGVYVALTADIDMAGATWERGIGDGINATFDGIFDGKNFTIKNLKLAPKADNENPETAYLCGGLFGYTYGAAEIKNLVLENITVTSTDAGHNVGVLVGFANNNGGKLTVSNVTVKNVTIDAPNAYGVGAIVGYSYRTMGTIENCTVDGATIKGQRFVGGITGYSYSNATITGCTVKNATISGQIGVGGIAGLALSGNKITDNTVADTTVSALKNWGYVVGELGASSANVSNNTAAEPQIGGDYATGEAYVAKIGDKYYTTLQAAVDAAKAVDTIVLIRDIATSETVTIADGKKITLDMNGKKITVTDNATNNYELFYIYGEMIVTGDGTIELTSTNNRAWNAMSAIFHNRGGVLTIENGTFKNLGGTDMAWVVDNSGNWYGDATTVINGGTLTSTYTAIRNRMEQNTHGASGKAILVINGGTIDGTTSAIWAQAASISTVAPATGSITVNGGNIGLINTARSAGAECMTTINGGTVASFKGETGELTVNGGKITGTITICHDNGDVAKYKVKKDGVYYAAVAKVGTTYYATLQEAIDACSVGGKVTLVDNAKGPGVVINKDITINFANYTYTLTEGVGSTGTESNGFQILAGNKVTLSAGTLKVAEEAADKFYILVQNYADLSCFNMKLDGTYLDKWSKTDGDSYVLSNNSGYISLTGKTYITTNNDGDKAFAFDACDSKYYADKPVVFAATTVKIDGKAISESYDKIEAAARIGSTQFFASLKEAFAYASNGNTIKLMADVAVSEGITNTKKVTLDLNGKTITGTDNATGSFAIITNKGQLTITGNGKITLTATNNRGWNAYSSVISNTVGGKLIVESGTIEHRGGTDMAYGIDNLTNGKGTYAETIINGGTIMSTYRAIRMFLNGVEAQNILTINGGVVEGANKSVWMQDPSKNANTGNLTVTKGATLNGDVYLTVTAGSTQWPVEVSIADSAVNGEVLTSNVPTGYKLVNNKGVYSVEKVKVYVAQVGVTKYESLQAAIDACPDYGKVTLLCDAKGPGVVIDKNITILFNGHTYTITEPVGSAGTETLGFQILKGNKVVLNNGKIEIAEEAADKFAILIQNYGNLTVYQMTLDGTNLGRYENYSYVLSVNCGKVTVNGKSVLTAKDGEGNYALDVYDYSSAGYSLPTVTVTSVVKINGKISAGAKYSTVYYATVEQAKAANPGKNVTVLN